MITFISARRGELNSFFTVQNADVKVSSRRSRFCQPASYLDSARNRDCLPGHDRVGLARPYYHVLWNLQSVSDVVRIILGKTAKRIANDVGPLNVRKTRHLTDLGGPQPILELIFLSLVDFGVYPTHVDGELL